MAVSGSQYEEYDLVNSEQEKDSLVSLHGQIYNKIYVYVIWKSLGSTEISGTIWVELSWCNHCDLTINN